MERMWLWISHNSPTGLVCCLKWNWCLAFILVWGKYNISIYSLSYISICCVNASPLLSTGVMAVRCSPLTAPDLNVKIVTTLTSVKAASRHANTIQDIPLAELTSLVSHTFTKTAPLIFLFECVCVCVNLSFMVSTTRPVSSFLWPFWKTAQEAS